MSPSSYGRLKAWKDGKECGLQLLFSGAPPLAPFSAAKLGDVVHKVMESVDENLDLQAAGKLWDEKCAKIDEKLSASPVTRGLVPLSQTARGYAYRRLMTIRMASRRSLELRDFHVVQEARERGNLFKEEPLESKDKLLRGQIDRLEKRDGGWVLVDYKSGGVLDLDQDGTEEIKSDYQSQLLLYAVLLSEVKGITIHKAVLTTLDGFEHEMTIRPDKAAEAAREARQLLEEFNKVAQKDRDALARPLPNDKSSKIFGCLGCLYRPVCKSYLGAKRLSEENKKWPNDVIGSVTSINKIHNRVRVTIQPCEGAKEVSIDFRDLTGRHQMLEGIKKSDLVGVFDYVSGRTANYDGPRSCLYIMDALA